MKFHIKTVWCIQALIIMCTYLDVSALEVYVPEPGTPESLMFNRINSAREQLASEAVRLGFDEVAAGLTGDSGLPPLVWNNELAMVALEHARDMLSNRYYSHMSPDGSGPLERVAAAMDNVVFLGESIGGIALDFTMRMPADMAVDIICDSLIKDAVTGGEEGAALLDPMLSQIGIAIVGGQIDIGDQLLNVYIAVVETALLRDNDYMLCGHVFVDKNSDGRYGPGEGMPDMQLNAQGPVWPGFVTYWTPEAVTLVSGRDGQYCFQVSGGWYNIGIALGDQALKQLTVQPDCSVNLDIDLTDIFPVSNPN